MKLRDIITEIDYDNVTGEPIDYEKEKRIRAISRERERRYKKRNEPKSKKGKSVDIRV